MNEPFGSIVRLNVTMFSTYYTLFVKNILGQKEFSKTSDEFAERFIPLFISTKVLNLRNQLSNKNSYWIWIHALKLWPWNSEKLSTVKHLLRAFIGIRLNPKRAGEPIWPILWLFQNASDRERLKPCFFVTFNIIIGCIFLENFIEIPHVVQKIWKFPPSMLTIFIDFFRFLAFHCYKETNDVSKKQTMSTFFHFQLTSNKLFNNRIKLYWFEISSSWNIKGQLGRSNRSPQKELQSKTQPY